MFRPVRLAPFALALAACSPAGMTGPVEKEAVVLEEPAAATPQVSGSAKSSAIIAPVPLPGPPPRPGRPAKRGVITAGDIDDTLNLAAFQRYVTRSSKDLRLPRLINSRSIRLQILDLDNRPAPGTFVTLRKSSNGDPFWSGYAGPDGLITVFPSDHGAGTPRTVYATTIQDNGQSNAYTLDTSGPRHKLRVSQNNGWKPEFLDLAIVLDTTGSMQDEIDWITKEIKGIAANARRAVPGVNIRFGLVSYKAPGDYPPVQSFGFTSNLSTMRGWLKSLSANGGYGGDEVVARGLEAGVAMNWRRGKGERILIQIGDEPPSKSRAKAYLSAARKAAQKGIHVYGLGASGVDESLEFLLRSAAAHTQGRYVFLTDDSGVGLAHKEPSIACYRVTRLNALMNRILRSELTGRRIEAYPSEVIRTVGAYNNGRCLN